MDPYCGELETQTTQGAAGTTVESDSLSYLDASGDYQNGNQASDTFMLAGPDTSAPCRTLTSTCTAGWSYDAGDRVIYDNTGTSQTYLALDAAGNVASQMAGWQATTSTYSGQKLASQTSPSGVTTRYLYDDQGNLSCQVASSWTLGTCPDPGSLGLLQSYHYDFKNRLAAYTQYDGYGSATDSASYVPDALDRTVSETETHSGSTTTTATVYQGDSTAVTQETLTGAQTGTKTYAYDASGDAITLSTSYSNRYSYLYDPRNSVSLLVDQAGGVKESYGYSAYGSANTTLSKKASGFSTGVVPVNPVRFQGKHFDSGSASYDMGARRYSPSVGRWLSQDMYYGALDDLGLSQDPLTANRYAFLGANPINYVELDGHSPMGCHSKGCEPKKKPYKPSRFHRAVNMLSSIVYAPYYYTYTAQNWVHKRSHFLGHVTTVWLGPLEVEIAGPSLVGDIVLDVFKKRMKWEKRIADEHNYNWHPPKRFLPGLYWHKDGKYKNGKKKQHLSFDWSY